ncbi:MAG TPA: XrtA system polysaccharide deacetylase [Steroidobacteraceae bacterium]|nr:XrtA system polysaccharide deacetylase [Steroidobacteraceae bacterium]
MSEVRSDLVNAMTVDVEDYYHVTAFAGSIARTSWPTMESRVERNTLRLLEIFSRHGVRATFFVLGWVAQRTPALIRELHRAGHEIACHGLTHELVYKQTPGLFRSETLESKNALEDLIGARVRGYRAASYSITAQSLWALDILHELGFDYDSSIFPVRHDLYGIPGASRQPFKVANGRLLEVPLTTLKLAGQHLPCAGGGYFRLFPYTAFRWALRRVNAEAMPAVFYMHPWEIDPGQPRIAAPWLSRFRHYTNLHRTEARLEALLREFRWGSMEDVFLSGRSAAGTAVLSEALAGGAA